MCTVAGSEGSVSDIHSHPHRHAGDIGDLAVLDELARIAPIRAVRGNIDNALNNPGAKMMPLKEFYRYEFVGN